jgi:hypothetical protein
MALTNAGILTDGHLGGERVASLIAERAITELPAYGQILEQHHTAATEIDANPWIPEEKERRHTTLRESTRAKLTVEFARLEADWMREFDQRDGVASATARRDDVVTMDERQFRRQQALETEWALRINGIASEENMDALESLATEAALTENPRVYRAALNAITKQTHALALSERRKNANGENGPAWRRHMELVDAFDGWKRQNRTPSELKAEIAADREYTRYELNRSALKYRQLYGLDPVHGR